MMAYPSNNSWMASHYPVLGLMWRMIRHRSIYLRTSLVALLKTLYFSRSLVLPLKPSSARIGSTQITRLRVSFFRAMIKQYYRRRDVNQVYLATMNSSLLSRINLLGVYSLLPQDPRLLQEVGDLYTPGW